jgi:hypothetical protein
MNALALPVTELGPDIERVWKDLRPITRRLLERERQSQRSSLASHAPRAVPSTYDARTDWEIGRFLTALDEHIREAGAQVREAGASQRKPDNQKRNARDNARDLADVCARVLMEHTQSAEVFAQLIIRAQHDKDYKRVDELATILAVRLAPSEVCELARSSSTVVRAIAQDVLTHEPAPVLAALLRDPVDAEVARLALERQANDYGSDDAGPSLAESEPHGISS